MNMPIGSSLMVHAIKPNNPKAHEVREGAERAPKVVEAHEGRRIDSVTFAAA
jgi:hypothetical protein